MEKIKNLVKASPVLMAVLGLFVAGIASAALLSVYVTATGTADVQQSVTFGDDSISKTYVIGNSPAIAGNTYTKDYNLKNKSVTTAPIQFATNQCMVGGGHCNDEDYNEDGLETSYWSSVDLVQKDTDTWEALENDVTATVTYELASAEFNYELEAEGLDSGENYSLIYYADKQDRFENWGGDNPGALIVEVEADEDGNISVTGTKELSMNLPHIDDWNGSADADYCDNEENDNYNLCRGAKIWLVLSSDYDGGEVSWVNYDSYLYETDLITYDDTDGGMPLNMFEGKLNFFIKNIFDIAAAPGEYKVKTEVQPVVDPV
ncbi:MAG: hypothetical protein KAJ58_01405 [Candidatus Pacebacteria bacterium]|nr:hypothetical protein [Candidatus Paceibacterota bacterium]